MFKTNVLQKYNGNCQSKTIKPEKERLGKTKGLSLQIILKSIGFGVWG
jgi:hypothetical protein